MTEPPILQRIYSWLPKRIDTASQPMLVSLRSRCRGDCIKNMRLRKLLPDHDDINFCVAQQLGDPRFDGKRFYLPCRYKNKKEPLLGFVKIDKGLFVMGSRKGDKDADDNEYGNPETLTIDYDYSMACTIWNRNFVAAVAPE